MNSRSLIRKHPKVSVCVITYNQGKYIRQCLQSIVDQKTDFDFDIVVGDDLSTDETPEILREFAVNSDYVAWEVIADIGPIGLEWLANNIVEQLPTDEKYRVEYWKEDCHEALTPATENILEKAMKDFEEYRKHQPEYVPEAQPRTLDEALQEIRSKKPKTSPLRTLGKRFSHAEVLTVANLWLNEWDDQIGACYARLFEVRDFPMPIQFVADRVLTGNSPIDFENVLSAVNDPICRLLGLHLIEQSEPDWRGYTCLVSSFLDDDIPLLVDSLPKFVALDHGDLHDLCAALRDAAETIPSKLRTPILEWTYENNPCSFCRTQYAQMMLEDGTLSDFHRKELEFDASSESRQLVTK